MIVVDVETTGQVPGRHAIVSIGALELKKPANQFYGECRIDKDTVVEPQALEINGFSEAQVRDKTKPTLSELIVKFDAWFAKISHKTIGGHNTGFDINMLWAAYRQAGLHAAFGYRHIDLHSLVYTHMLKRQLPIPELKNRSAITFDVVAKYTGLADEPVPHNALTGAKMEAEALNRLIYGKVLLPDYKEYPVPSYLKPSLEQS